MTEDQDQLKKLKIDRFNAGYEAYKKGYSVDNEFQCTAKEYVTWKLGWFWAKYNEMMAEMKKDEVEK